MAPVEAFRQANLDYACVLSGMRFTLDKRPDGKPYFKIKTDRPVNDPFIDLLVELSWSSGRLVREYAFLLDPPELKNNAAASAVVTPPVVQSGSLQPAPDTAPIAPPMANVQEIIKPAVEPDAPATTNKIEKPPVSPVSHKPAAAESAPSVADSGGSRKVKSGDTLSKIAGEHIVEGVTLNQMLVALFNNNRDAFIGGNMNRLRAGKILSIPDAATVAEVGDFEARKVVAAQSADFNVYRNALAGVVAGQSEIAEQATQTSGGKISPKVEEPTASDSGKDRLQVSRSDADAKAIAPGKETEEDRIAREKALKEANSRIADLQKNLGDLKVLAEMKSKGTTDAPKGMPSAISDAPPPVAPASPAIGADGAASVSAVATETAVSATTALPAVEDMPQPKQIVAPSPLASPSFIDENPLLVYGGGAAIVALLGFLGFRSWKRKREADIDNFTVTGMATGSMLDTASSDSVDSDLGQSGGSDFGHSTLDALDSAKAGVDPVQEAEVYMAYGRDVQAEEILREALGKDPSNLAVAVKLLEIYAGRKSLPQFNEVASDLHGRTTEDSPEWRKAVELGSALDPSNPLYGAIELSSDVVVDDLEGLVTSTPSPESVPPSEEVLLPPAVDEASSVLDFDLDLPASTDQASAVSASSDLDFDLDLGGNGKVEIGGQSASGLDIDLDSPAGSNNSIDFDLSEVSTAGSDSAPPLDLSSISLELDPPKASSAIADSPDAASKLELAHAYEEMGDHEGARELLQEVIAEGSPAQQESARSKLAQLK